MLREYREWWSPALERDIEQLVFGAQGTPVFVFLTPQERASPADLHLWDGRAHDRPLWKDMVDVFL